MSDISELLRRKSQVRIDLGGGGNPQPGFLNVDYRDLPTVDIVHNLCVFPWPLPDGCADLVMASHLLEHINPTCFDPRFGLLVELLVKKKLLTPAEVQKAIGETDSPPVFMRFMDEVHRILKPGGQFMIAMPHGRSEGFMQDPTHVACRNETTWAYFDPQHPHDTQGVLFSIYKPKPWRVIVNNWQANGNMEVLLERRDFDSLPAPHAR